MKIETIKVGNLETNCYLLIKDNECLIVDPGDEINKIITNIGNNQPLAILITHYHFDHIGALNELVKKYNIPIYDYQKLGLNKINNFKFETIATKGHHNTCVTFYFEELKKMFVGDFIFKDGIGRTDLEGGNMKEMLASLALLKKYNQDIILYPGHGPYTTIKEEL